MVAADHEVVAIPSRASIAGSLAALACGAAGMFHANRAPDCPKGGQRAATGSPAGGKGLAGIAAWIVTRIAAAIADELRIRRDMRQLMAMDDHMLSDIGLTRADVGSAVRYGRD